MKTSLQTVNPWRGEGVSIIPDDLSALMPLVGQENLFRRLEGFRREMIDKPHRDALAGFFLIIGGWGVGKSRIGHEICLEALTDEVAWIVDSQPHRVLRPGLAEGILPLFVRYSQVTTGPLGERLEVENWIPRVALEALSRLAGLRPSTTTNQPLKNQDRLLALARKTLRAKPGWEAVEPRLRQALAEDNPDKAVRQALVVLREVGVEHVWVVVDEIEDITDVERDGLNPGDREGIDQALLTVIPRVIKQEEVRQEFPQLNFLLLCSQAVGNNLQGIKAIERRTGWYPMATNSFADVEAFFQFLRTHRPAVHQGMADYPAGLKEAAFFAANRNFGWFNVIMYQAHQNHRGGQLGVPEILKKFATESPRGHKGSVFDLDQISSHWLPHDGDFPLVEHLLFGLLPPAIGTGPGAVSPADAQRLLAITHLGNEGRKLFTRLVEVKPPARHLITAHLVSCGFKNPEGNELHLPGESRFSIKEVLDSLQAYSIALPADRREHLLLPEEKDEFIEQVRALSPYADEAERFAPYLHGLLALPEYRQRDGGQERAFLAPAFSFLQRFHRLNKLRRADVGYLRDDRKNTRLKDACERLKGSPRDRHETQLRGLAFAWEQKLVPCEAVAEARLPIRRVVTTEDPRNPAWNPLHVATDHRISWLWAGGAGEADLLADLQRLAREPLHPIVAILEGGEQQAADLRQRLARIAPAVASCLIVHPLSGPEAELLLAFGLLGQEFAEEDLKTRYFAGGIEMARQRLDQAAKTWRQQAEGEGLVLRSIFPGRAAKEDELLALARGYAAMLGGASYNALLQSPGVVFADPTERDLFRKAVERHVDPGPKYREYPTLGLLTDQAGELVAQVPRPLLALTERCGGVARTRADLERQFFCALPPDTRPADAVRQLCWFLVHLGLLEPEGEKFRRTQVTSLVAACDRGLAWLNGEFARKAEDVRAVHQEPGEALLNRHAKQARHDLNEARKGLQTFSLDFLSEKWSELEKPGSDGRPLYVSRFQSALAVLAQVRSTAERVYDPDAFAAFQYAPEGLEDFETQSLQPGYPLWRRVAVLSGFYADLARRRHVHLKAIGDWLDESDRRVPASPGGEKLFPTQALALPLALYRQELEFTPDSPQRTVTGWGTAHATNSLGFKLHSGKYQEARQRLNAIEHEIAQPGGLVDRYRRALASWEEVIAAHARLAAQVDALFAFFADAPAPVRESFGLAEVRRQEEELAHVATGGGMREGTDGRESAGTAALQLIDGLEEDVAQVRGLPVTLEAKIASVENSVLVVLNEEYNARHKALMNAHARVREAQRLPAQTTWPQARGETYHKTVVLFDAVVRRAEQEGSAYLPEGGLATFRDFVALCGQDLDGREIDWDDRAVDRMLPVLKEKKLVRLRLI